MRPVRRFSRLGLVLSLCQTAAFSSASAKEIHLVCARAGQSVSVDVDTDRLFVQLMWGEGVAEEYQNGESYVSGERQKVTYAVSVDKDAVAFGQDHICVDAAAHGKCKELHIRNLLDASSGVLKYDDGGLVTTLKCGPAPPGRRF